MYFQSPFGCKHPNVPVTVVSEVTLGIVEYKSTLDAVFSITHRERD